ncbi:MAG: HD domain-containing protein [Candidatus Woesearchaeota archaeon]|nr:HD domain-containing protein [Candidatus Woesearchaeota archaeon]
MPEIIRKKQFIKDFKQDQIVNDIFVVKFKKPIEPYKNGYKFELRLGDSSREIMYKYWGPPEEAKVKFLYDMIKPDDVVLAQGRVNEWKGQFEISANEENKIKILSKNEYDIRDFVRMSSKPIEEMFKELMSYVGKIENKELKKLLEYFFNDENFAKRFRESPAAMYIHHGWVGGLLEHTLSVVKLCEDIFKIHDGMDRDLLITGAILHDIGKLEEFAVTTSIKVSTKGMLLGHVTIGIEMLLKAMEQLKTPEEIKLKILHIIITHMGEYGSNKLPSFPEALTIYYADELDAKVLQMREIKETAQTEDDYFYHKDFGNVYLR